MVKKTTISLIFCLSLFFFPLSHPVFSSSYQIPEGSVASLKGNLQLVAGRLSLKGGGGEVLLAVFTSSNPAWLPEVEFQRQEDVGLLTMKQPVTLKGFFPGPLTYSWELQLADSTPLDLNITLGAAVGELNFSGTSLKALKLTAGMGDVNLKLNNTPLLHSLEVRMGVGNLQLALSGPRTRDVSIIIYGGIGQATIYLPQDVGVLVDVKGGLGRIRAQGFLVHDSTYVNQIYGETEGSIQLDIRAGLGEIRLIQVEDPGV